MALRFTHRLTRLIRADAHGIIESLEDRSLLLKQHLREAELELQRKRARVAALGEEETRLADNAARLERAVAALDEDTRLALEGEREDLARFALRKLIPKRCEAEATRGRIEEIRAERDHLAPTLAAQEALFDELRDRIHQQLALEARAGDSLPARAESRAAEEEVEMELLRRSRTVGGNS
ncbi:MAG: PspA/IM30 family protein [Myxococcota bacterium]